MRLIDDLARKDRQPVFRIHLHPFEGHRVLVAELASHHYPVARASAHHLFTAALHSSWVSERSARRDGSSSPTGKFPLGDMCGFVGRLDEPPGVGFLHGFTAGGELAAKQPDHVVLALGQLPVKLSLTRLARAKLPFLALKELGEHAGVRIVVQYALRLGEHHPGSGSVATRGSYRRER